MTLQIPIISFPLPARPFRVRSRQTLRDRRIFVSWAAQVAQNSFFKSWFFLMLV